MRILYLSASGSIGGAERVLLTLVERVLRCRPDWQLGLLAFEPGPLIASAREAGAEADVLHAPAALLRLGESGAGGGWFAADLARAAWPTTRYAGRVAARVCAWRPDVLHTNGLKAHVIGARCPLRAGAVLWHIHEHVGRRRLSSALLRVHAKRVARVVAVSESVATDIRGVLGTGLATRTILNGIDTERFESAAAPLDLDAAAGLPPAPPGTVRVGLVATYAHWKGHLAFLSAMAALPAALPARGYIVGGPVYSTRGSQYTTEGLLSAIHAAGLSGRVGLVPFQDDTAASYAALDVVVHASTEPEPFGLVVVEAMAAGRAVIASNAGGTREIVEHDRTGLLHAPGHVPELAAAIERLVVHRHDRERLGAAAREHARVRFRADTMTRDFVATYESLAPSCAGAPREDPSLAGRR
jgi:glycosyltransferase involved in cell wall biosynthesis